MFSEITAIGNIGGDAEKRSTPAGQTVVSFSMACNRTWKNDAGEKQKETTWLRCTVWGKQGEAIHQYLTKGKSVLVKGRLQVDPATGGPRMYKKSDGTTATSFEVTADNVRLLGGGNADGNGNGGSSETAYAEVAAVVSDLQF